MTPSRNRWAVYACCRSAVYDTPYSQGMDSAPLELMITSALTLTNTIITGLHFHNYRESGRERLSRLAAYDCVRRESNERIVLYRRIKERRDKD